MGTASEEKFGPRPVARVGEAPRTDEAAAPPRVPALGLRTALLGPERILRRLARPLSRRVRDPLPRLGREMKELRLRQIQLTRRLAWLEETARRGEAPPRSERL